MVILLGKIDENCDFAREIVILLGKIVILPEENRDFAI